MRVNRFQFVVERSDVSGHMSTSNFIVIAKDEAEALTEVAAVFDGHEEITNWNIKSKVNEQVYESDPSFLDYRSRGPHSYFERV
jgi:hypothetical protein